MVPPVVSMFAPVAYVQVRLLELSNNFLLIAKVPLAVRRSGLFLC